VSALISNDAVVFGLLAATLGAIFWTEQHPRLRGFYRYVPALLLCYFVPAIYNTLGLIDGDSSQLYHVASRYLLPATLVLLTLSIDLPSLLRLGPKPLVLFLTGTVGVILGGPFALWIWRLLAPETFDQELWRSLSVVAGGWIGGSANQVAMKEIFTVPDELFGAMIAVDIIVQGLWMACCCGWRRTRNDSMRGAAPIRARSRHCVSACSGWSRSGPASRNCPT
jgi:uncharacterized membrane protein